MSAVLSQAALRELQNPAPVGQRHAQVVRLACRLCEDGCSAAETFHRLRANYDPATLPDAEISAAIAWAQRTIPERFGRLIPATKVFPRNPKNLLCPAKSGFGVNPKNLTGDCQQTINRFLAGFSFGEPDLFDASPIKLPGNFRKDAELAFESLYSPAEKLNIVIRFREELTPKQIRKTYPLGFGETLSRNEWIDSFRSKSIPETPAGAWFRINPVNGNGISDGDISEFRFALLESDFLPLETQISLLAKLPIPICTILNSGGKSVHAWIRIAATNAGEYREQVSKLYSLLAAYGFDPSNKNPSRLSRLPGAQRVIGANGDGKQRLLYLNPEATDKSIA